MKNHQAQSTVIHASLFYFGLQDRVTCCEQTDDLMGLPAFAVDAGGIMVPFTVPNEPARSSDMADLVDAVASHGTLITGSKPPGRLRSKVETGEWDLW